MAGVRKTFPWGVDQTCRKTGGDEPKVTRINEEVVGMGVLKTELAGRWRKGRTDRGHQGWCSRHMERFTRKLALDPGSQGTVLRCRSGLMEIESVDMVITRTEPWARTHGMWRGSLLGLTRRLACHTALFVVGHRNDSEMKL